MVTAFTCQVSRDEEKLDLLKKMGEIIAKSRMEDDKFLKEFIKTVNHEELNVTTKVRIV